MAELTVTPIRKAGIAAISAVLSAADVAGDSVKTSSGIFVAMTNGDGSPHTLTVAAIVSEAECGNLGELPVSDITLVVAAGETGFLAIPQGYSGGGLLSWTYDAITSVTIGVFSIAP